MARAERGTVKLGVERRLFHCEIRAGKTDSAPLTLTGYACTTDDPYDMADMWGDEYTEVVRGGAFGVTLRNKDDVRLLLNHEGLPLARTKSGTMNLAEDSTGLAVDAQLEPKQGLANDVKLAMERGDLDQMSFAFQVVQQMWSPDFTQRDITEVKLFDVSVVTYPANPGTSASIRSLLAKTEDLSDDDARALYGRLHARFAATGVQLTAPVSAMSRYRAMADSMAVRKP